MYAFIVAIGIGRVSKLFIVVRIKTLCEEQCSTQLLSHTKGKMKILHVSQVAHQLGVYSMCISGFSSMTSNLDGMVQKSIAELPQLALN